MILQMLTYVPRGFVKIRSPFPLLPHPTHTPPQQNPLLVLVSTFSIHDGNERQISKQGLDLK